MIELVICVGFIAIFSFIGLLGGLLLFRTRER